MLLLGGVGYGLDDGTRVELADGQTAWVFHSGGKQVLTMVGFEVDLVRCLRRAPEGLVLEFGVAGGESIRRLAKAGRLIYGFDWWKGLPHAWNEEDERGTCLAVKPLGLPPNVTLVEGLFSDTLEAFLEVHRDPVSFVHVDCDLYCSSFYVLHCLVDRFVAGSIVAFDEIALGHFGEAQAWDRYLSIAHQDWKCLGKQHAWGEVWQRQ